MFVRFTNLKSMKQNSSAGQMQPANEEFTTPRNDASPFQNLYARGFLTSLLTPRTARR